MAKVLSVILWIVTITGAVLGGVGLVMGVLMSAGAPQEAAAGAVGVACAAIPYVLARAWDEIRRP